MIRNLKNVILLLSFAAAILLAACNDNEKTVQNTELMRFQKIDKLFTTFAYVPVIELTRGPQWFTLGLGEDILNGYCWRQYEVGIGYDSASSLFEENLDYVCAGYYDSLPAPVILSTNPVSSESFGKYGRMKCDMWDMEVDGERKSRELILEQLIKDGQWESIVENSKQTLAGFIRIYCPE